VGCLTKIFSNSGGKTPTFFIFKLRTSDGNGGDYIIIVAELQGGGEHIEKVESKENKQ
jgi:hypothetical protein